MFNLEFLHTGDVLLFEDTSGYWFSTLVKWFTGSVYSHAAVVLSNPTYIDKTLNYTCMLESGFESFPDVENGQTKGGVQIVDLAEKIQTYEGHVWVRRLRTKVHQIDIDREVAELHSTFHNKPYDWNPADLLKTVLQIKDSQDQRTNSFFCSALVAYLYTKLGFLSKDELWDLDTPKLLASSDFNKRLVNAELGEMEVVK